MLMVWFYHQMMIVWCLTREWMNEFGGDVIVVFGVGTNGRSKWTHVSEMEDQNGADEMEDR